MQAADDPDDDLALAATGDLTPIEPEPAQAAWMSVATDPMTESNAPDSALEKSHPRTPERLSESRDYEMNGLMRRFDAAGAGFWPCSSTAIWPSNTGCARFLESSMMDVKPL